uniref:Uncharacterized protein n=1 Tax=Euplotes harpa TaxID=151035 RepID=A0A7S3JL51_9SPIT
MNIHVKKHEWPQTALIDEKNKELIEQHLIQTIKVSVLGWRSSGSVEDSQFEYLQIAPKEEPQEVPADEAVLEDAAQDEEAPDQEDTQEVAEGEGNE